jgi:hypothetical protein
VSMWRCITCGTGVIAPSSTTATPTSSSTPMRGRNPRIRSSRVCRRTLVYRYNIINR